MALSGPQGLFGKNKHYKLYVHLGGKLDGENIIFFCYKRRSS